MKNGIRKIINQIVKSLSRDRDLKTVVLFGLLVKGRLGSDIDLMVVRNFTKDQPLRDYEIRQYLSGIKYPLDIFVYTPDEFRNFKKQKDSFLNEILRQGKVIYGTKV